LKERYRNKVSKIVNDNIEEFSTLRNSLTDLYDDTVMVDELHVYAGIYYKYWTQPKGIKIPRTPRRELERVFEKEKKRFFK
jgi:hypothetical protein